MTHSSCILQSFAAHVTTFVTIFRPSYYFVCSIVLLLYSAQHLKFHQK